MTHQILPSPPSPYSLIGQGTQVVQQANRRDGLLSKGLWAWDGACLSKYLDKSRSYRMTACLEETPYAYLHDPSLHTEIDRFFDNPGTGCVHDATTSQFARYAKGG